MRVSSFSPLPVSIPTATKNLTVGIAASVQSLQPVMPQDCQTRLLCKTLKRRHYDAQMRLLKPFQPVAANASAIDLIPNSTINLHMDLPKAVSLTTYICFVDSFMVCQLQRLISKGLCTSVIDPLDARRKECMVHWFPCTVRR